MGKSPNRHEGRSQPLLERSVFGREEFTTAVASFLMSTKVKEGIIRR